MSLSGEHVYYPMPIQHGMYIKYYKTDTPVRFGNVRGSVLSTSTGFASDVIKQISEPVRYSQRSRPHRYDASARLPIMVQYIESPVTA